MKNDFKVLIHSNFKLYIKRERQVQKEKIAHEFILFLEKFIDKYNDFIQYFNTHMTSF